MAWVEKEIQKDIDITEIYRQNYEDALDEIRNLKFKIAELEIENNLLQKDIDRAERFIFSRDD